MLAINLVPIATGGGLQNALSFLAQLGAAHPVNYKFIIFCTKGSLIEKTCTTQGLPYESIPASNLSRVSYEFLYGRYLIRKHKVDLVFSLFGSAPLVCPYVYKISGFAYSNIIQPEVPFWNFLPPIKRIQKRAIDVLRTVLASQADEIILETEYLKHRVQGRLFKNSLVHVVKMAPSLLVTRGLKKCEEARKTIDIVYLAGPHPNKRIHLLADIFAQLNAKGLRFRLITTLTEGHSYTRLIADQFSKLGIGDAHENVGPVAPESVGALLSRVDAVINVALLESFSNNWVEAWAAKLPLIATDADWARASCEKAALYIDPENATSSALKITGLFENRNTADELVHEGELQLRKLPTAEQRFEQYIQIINNAYQRASNKK